MRKVPTQVSATTGNNGRTKGMPEVQKPVLEHAPTEAKEEITRETGVVNLVTSVTEIRKTDRSSVELGSQIGLLLAQVDKYTARAAYSIAGSLMCEHWAKDVSSESRRIRSTSGM